MVITGEARQVAKGIPNNSVDLILTDPEYNRLDDYWWLFEESRRILKPDGNALAFVNAKWYPVVSRIVASNFPPLACVQTSGPSGMNGRVIAKTYYLLWWGSGKLCGYMPDGYIGTTWSAANRHNFKWTKNPKFLKATLEAFTHEGGIVVDLFCGASQSLTSVRPAGDEEAVRSHREAGEPGLTPSRRRPSRVARCRRRPQAPHQS